MLGFIWRIESIVTWTGGVGNANREFANQGLRANDFRNLTGGQSANEQFPASARSR